MCDDLNSQSAEDNKAFIKESIKYQSVCKFCKDHPTITDFMSDSESMMVKCDRCHAWLHCHCVGISSKKFSAKNNFYCCRGVHPEDDLKWVWYKFAIAYYFNLILMLLQMLYWKQNLCCMYQIYKHYIQSKECQMQWLISLWGQYNVFLGKYMHVCEYLWPTLFHRQLLPKEASDFVAGALSYNAIVSVCNSCANTDTELKRKFLNTNGGINISHPILLFPCRTV